jgi:uncharacterized protein (TIGR01244 family)
MQDTQAISSDLAVASCQLTPEQIRQAAQENFKAVLNLRSPQEEGTLVDERERVEKAGLTYANIPVQPSDISDELTDRVLQAIDGLPKPVVIHCKSGVRSGAMALMYVATRNQMSAEEALDLGKQNGFDCDAHPQMKQFFEHYISTHQAG